MLVNRPRNKAAQLAKEAAKLELKRRQSMNRKLMDQQRITNQINIALHAKQEELALLEQKMAAVEAIQSKVYVGHLAGRLINKVNWRIGYDAKTYTPRKRMTVNRIAKSIAVDKQTLHRWLKFEGSISLNKMDELMSYVGLSVLDLLLPHELASIYERWRGEARWRCRSFSEQRDDRLQKILDAGSVSDVVLETPETLAEQVSQTDVGGTSQI